jgi:putative hydrolase of the HAD superfamily
MGERWPVHTLVFDLDDTLFAEADYVRSGFRAVDEWLTARHKITGFASEAEAVFAAGGRGKIFDEALRRLGRPGSAERIAELVTVYREHQPRIALLPDAVECLAWAGSRWRLALLTDGYQVVQRSKVAALGIANRFASLMFTDALGRECWKPQPAGFRRIMDEFPGPAAGFVYVGDNPRKDFIAPRQLGWRTVRIRRQGGEHAAAEAAPGEAADCEIGQLTELASLLVVAS